MSVKLAEFLNKPDFGGLKVCKLCLPLQQPSRPKGSSQPASQQKKVGADEPDIGLSGSHEFVKFLGRGGTGDTHLYKDRANGEEVAIKLVKRPVPKVVQPNLLREIRVRSLCQGSLQIPT